MCVRERAVGLVGLRKEQGHKIALCFTEAETWAVKVSFHQTKSSCWLPFTAETFLQIAANYFQEEKKEFVQKAAPQMPNNKIHFLKYTHKIFYTGCQWK